ncbi:DUF3348 family protein, partial [Pseudomonas frederiksbergensis]|nr:DUF3348 family protein [Pseudomonas frederiksbergensis]
MPQRTGFSGPKLLRLLASLSDAGTSRAAPSLSAVMSQWLDWTDAIALSTALNGNPPATQPGAPARPAIGDAAGTHVRAMLSAAILGQG